MLCSLLIYNQAFTVEWKGLPILKRPIFTIRSDHFVSFNVDRETEY